MMNRPIELEINDLCTWLEGGGMTPAAARKEAERIAASIGAHYRAKALKEAQEAVTRLN